MTLLAYHVWDDTVTASDEASHQIIFAETSEKAKYVSDAYHMNGEITDIKTNRVPEFDQYAEQQKVPIQVMLQQRLMQLMKATFL